MTRLLVFWLALCPAAAEVVNGGFESGGFDGWTADGNWVIATDTRGYYAGWAGRCWAWSGGTGEPAMGVLTSAPFRLDKPAVRLLISGWASHHGTGLPRRWNYVTLNLADGTEIDRVWAPDTTNFQPVYLDGSKHVGAMVFLRAVDDADEATYSMLCIDDVRTADLPADAVAPVPRPARFDARTMLALEDARWRVDIDRATGSIVRLLDRRGGLDVIREQRLAGAWRTSLVLPGRESWQTIEANWIHSRQQTLTGYRLEPGRLLLRWSGPLRNYLGEPYDLDATMAITLIDDGVLIGLRLDNHTPLPVGETYFPVLGGIRGFGERIGTARRTQLVRPIKLDPPTVDTATIFHTFANLSPFGDQGPELYWLYPDTQPAPWLGLVDPAARRGLLVGARDRARRQLYARLELVPSSAGTARDDGNWPRPSELRGAPVGVELSLVDPRIGEPGADYEAAPVFVRALDGAAAALAEDFAAWPAPVWLPEPDGDATTVPAAVTWRRPVVPPARRPVRHR